MLWKRDPRPDAAADPVAVPDVGESETRSLRRSNYRQPTGSGQQGLGAVLEWGSDMAGRGSELHLVLFIAAGGTIEQWRSPEDATVRAMIQLTGEQASAVIEWLAGRDKVTS